MVIIENCDRGAEVMKGVYLPFYCRVDIISVLMGMVFQEDAGVYTQLVRDMVTSGDCRIIVNINDLRQKNAHRTSG